jgi:hypothetical protein
MTFTRREFIRGTGITIATLVMARCVPAKSPKPSPTPTARDRLRDCWLRFDQLAQHTRDSWNGADLGEDTMNQFIQGHRAALDQLVSDGGLSADVADCVQSAYAAAAYHVWRSNVPVTCYAPMMVDYKPTSSDQLVRQAEVLAEMAKSGDLDPDAVARAQAVVERDIAFLALSSEREQAFYDALAQAGNGFPSFDQLSLNIPPEAIEAARFLVDLLYRD